jgi:hypothetical protein
MEKLRLAKNRQKRAEMSPQPLAMRDRSLHMLALGVGFTKLLATQVEFGPPRSSYGR